MDTGTIISVVLFIIILVALYHTYFYFNPQLLNDGDVIPIKQETGGQFEIGIGELEEPDAIRYFYDGWLRVNTVTDDTTKNVIFNRGNDFIVTLTGHTLSIYQANGVTGSTTNGVNKKSGVLEGGGGGQSHTKIVDIATNFPFQRWVYFCINVDENRIDLYLNGKLTKSVKGSDIDDQRSSANPKAKMDFTKFSTTSPISVGNTRVTGRLARFRREPGNMDPQWVWNTYVQGVGTSEANEEITGDYHARVSLLRKNRQVKSFTLF
jgi:hypothetical protein